MVDSDQINPGSDSVLPRTGTITVGSWPRCVLMVIDVWLNFCLLGLVQEGFHCCLWYDEMYVELHIGKIRIQIDQTALLVYLREGRECRQKNLRTLL